MTTIVIDRKKRLVASDSRCTNTTKGKLKISWRGVKFTEEEEFYEDNTQKVFKVGSTVITGCGSLSILYTIVSRFKIGKIVTPTTLFMRSDYELGFTKVYVNKVVGGKMYTLNLVIDSYNLPFCKMLKISKNFDADEGRMSSGSGGEFAMGVLYQGGGVEDAIECAKVFDDNSGGDMQVVYL